MAGKSFTCNSSNTDPSSFAADAGDDISLVVTHVDSAGAAIDIQAYSAARVALARTRGGTVVAGTETSPATMTAVIEAAANGNVTITILNAVTATLSGTYFWSLEIEDSSSLDSVIAFGYITFRPSSV